MDQQYSIDDQDQERHFIGNLLSDDEASAARSESSSRSSHKLSSLPSFENVTSNANAIGPSPNQAFWPEPPPPYSPPLSDTFAKWELEAAATGDVFNTFGCGKDKALFPGINSNSSYNPAYTSFTNDLVEDFYSELIKPFEGMPSRIQSKPPPPPSFNQIQQLNAKKALADKKKGRFLQKNMPPSDTELLKRKSEFSSDDLRDPNSFPCLYRQMSEHLPSATTQTSTGILPAGKSYRDVLSTKSTPPQHKPISGVLSVPGNNPKIPSAPILPPHGYSSKVARATSPPTGISSVKKGQSQKGLLPLSIGGVAKLGKNSTVTSAPPATDGLDMGEKAGVEKRAEKQRTIVGLNPIDSQNGNKFGDKSNAKESDSFQKIDRKKKVTKISSNQTSPPQSKNSILAALEIANGKPKNSSGKTTSISKLSEKVKEDQKKSQAFDEQEFEPILTRKNVMKNDVDERMDSDDETFENHTETSDDEDDDVFYAQQNYRLKQKARRGTDPEPKRLLSTSENMPARKKKNKQQHPLPIVYLIMFLTLAWEALVKFGTWIVNLIVDVACLSYWAIVEAATATAWKIVLVYRSCVHTISAFFKNIFLGLWNALKAGIRLTNGCSSEDQFLVGLEENIVLPTCCEEVLERLYTCHPIDAYSILGLKSDCTLEDIRRHYKRQAYLIRPERRLNFGIEQAHRLLTAAFDLLKEPDLRREYDLELLNRVKLKNSELYSLIYDLRWNIDNSTHILHCDCGMEHLVYRLPEMKPLRYCKKCGERHLAKNNDIWVETRIFGLIWTYYTCLNGICFDITNWANCEHNHLKHIKANSHQAYYRLQNVSLLPGQGDLKKHRCTQGFDDSPIYHANFQAYRNAVERLGGVNSNLSKSTFICCCTNSLLNTVESLESVLEEDYIPGVACCMGGTYIGVSTNASAFSCSRSSVDLDPDRAKRAGRRRRIR